MIPQTAENLTRKPRTKAIIVYGKSEMTKKNKFSQKRDLNLRQKISNVYVEKKQYTLWVIKRCLLPTYYGRPME